jgi:alpha-tubulin suppressor-like RCC1 family protein
MRQNPLAALGMLVFLSGCGTLQINIDYGLTPAVTGSESAGAAVSSPAAEETTLPSTLAIEPTPGMAQTPSPTSIVPLVLHAAAISSGEKHTCVVTDLGGVNCWGNNEHGQLGNGTMVNSNIPVEVKGLENVKAVAAGWAHVCVLTREGGVKCWGYNKNGELGNGKTVDSSVPVEVNGLSSGVASIATKEDHTCAVTEEGAVKCWGYNEFGQLGDGTRTTRSVPVDVQGLAGKVTVAAAGLSHTCVLSTGGGVKCWGNNQDGQLGFGQAVEYRFTAVDVTDLDSGVIGISAAGGQTCALRTGGGIRCWGNNKYGQLGDGTAEIRNVPVDVDGLSQGVGRVVTGWNHTCAVMGNGELKCWGWNYYGQLGDETKATQSRPVNVRRLMEDAVDVAPGWAHTCAVTAAGGVKCWGLNDSGQLGDGTNLDSIVPLSITGLRSSLLPPPTADGSAGKAQAVTAGAFHACALTSSGGVKCWGKNDHGQLGDGTQAASLTPVSVVGLTQGVVAVSASMTHTCALTGAGAVKCWGQNMYGGLGDGSIGDRSVPVDVVGLSSGVFAVSAGGGFTCALMEDGRVKCWGYNQQGALGDGTTTDHFTPVDVQGLGSDNSAIASGAGHACVLTTSGGVKCWGSNGYGQLGDGKVVSRSKPAFVVGVTSGARGISAGWSHTCAVLIEGEILCWGANGTAQLGDGTQGDEKTFPVIVAGLTENMILVGAGDNHTCALTVQGGVRCWGSNTYGQLGDGMTLYGTGNILVDWRIVPVAVLGLETGGVALSAGSNFTCAMTNLLQVKCWGANAYGQLGNGTTVDRNIPVLVGGL